LIALRRVFVKIEDYEVIIPMAIKWRTITAILIGVIILKLPEIIQALAPSGVF